MEMAPLTLLISLFCRATLAILAEPVGCCGDLDGSGTVDFSDFLILSANFGGANVAAAAVPEPTNACLAMFGALGLIGFRRRR